MKQDTLMFSRVLHEFGIQPGKRPSAVPQASTPTVDEPIRLVAHGLIGVKRGDRVKVANLGRGKWKVEHLSTGNSITRNISDILRGSKGPMFRR